MSIQFLITGGTIDKVYNELTGELEFDQTHIVDMLNRGRSMVDTESEVLFLKDSLDMSDNDRELILSKCINSSAKQIVITHGTDTIVQTAKLLGDQIKDKVVVLFGAMIPYSINNSDALFNLGLALSAVQANDNGVYVAMNGKVFNFNNVEKNKTLGIFEDA